MLRKAFSLLSFAVLPGVVSAQDIAAGRCATPDSIAVREMKPTPYPPAIALRTDSCRPSCRRTSSRWKW